MPLLVRTLLPIVRVSIPRIVPALGVAATVCLPGHAAGPPHETPEPDGRVHFRNAQAEPIGQARLRATPNGVLVTVALRDVPPGEHGFHIHENGVCVPPFDSAGGHFDPTNRAHGFDAAGGPHVGDLPNLVVPDSGEVNVQFFVPGASLDDGGSGSLVDANGSAFVIHAKADDYRTDPAGDAGSRIACGVVERPPAR